MKNICVLSYSGINDSRAQRTIQSMSKHCQVDFFYIGEKGNTKNVSFNSNVTLIPIREKNNLIFKIIQHSFLFLVSNFFVKEVKAQKKRYDVVYAHDFVTSFAAFRIACFLHSKIIYDVHDLFLETINQFFPRDSTYPKRALYNFSIFMIRNSGFVWERYFFKKVDLTLTTNSNYLKYLNERYSLKQSLITPNYPKYQEVKKTEDLYSDLSIDKTKNIILYHGNLNDGRYLELIVDSARFLRDEFIMVIIGNGSLKNDLQRRSLDYLNKKIVFIDFVEYSKLLSFISSASLGIMLIAHINLSKKYALANKVTEYMAAGIPVLASESPENIRIITEAACGFTKDFQTPQELATFIHYSFDNYEMKQLGLNGKIAFKEKFNWDLFEKEFEKEFEILINLK